MCWMAAVAVCMVIIVCVLMMESSFRMSSPHTFTFTSLQQKCKLRHENRMQNLLTHQEKTNLYLHVILNDDESFEVDKYEDIFKGVQEHHPNHMLNLIVLHNDTFDVAYRRNTRFKDWELYHNQLDQPKFFETDSVENDRVVAKNIPKNNTKYSNVNLIRSTFSNYFQHSPLRFRWRIMAPELMPVILKILTLWEHGGITMPWQLFIDKTDIYCPNKDSTGKLQEIVGNLKKEPEVKTNKPIIETKKENTNDKLVKYVVKSVNETKSIDSIQIDDEDDNSSDKIPETVIIRTKPKISVKVKENQPENDPLNNGLKQPIKLTNSSSVMSQSSLSVSKDSDIVIKNRKEKERLFIADKRLIKDLNTEMNIPSDSTVIDREIGKLMKNSKQPKKGGDPKFFEDVTEESGDKPKGRRVKRDLSPKRITKELGKLDNTPNKDFKPPKSLLEYKSWSYSSDSYYSDYESGSYSGLNAQQPFKTNRGKKKVPDFELEWSSSSSWSSTESSDSDSSSEEDNRKGNYFKESKAYVKHKVFDNFNIFALPGKINVVFDKFGYYFSTKKPCHSFLGNLISSLQAVYEHIDAETLVSEGLKSFCRGRKFNDCVGITLL